MPGPYCKKQYTKSFKPRITKPKLLSNAISQIIKAQPAQKMAQITPCPINIAGSSRRKSAPRTSTPVTSAVPLSFSPQAPPTYQQAGTFDFLDNLPYYVPDNEYNESFPEFVDRTWNGKDPAERFQWNKYIPMPPLQCPNFACGKCARHIEYDPAKDTTQVVYELCQIARYAGIKLMNYEYQMFKLPWMDAPQA